MNAGDGGRTSTAPTGGGDDGSAAPAGLVAIRSTHDVPVTIERLIAGVNAKGMTVFARIDHGAGAAAAGLVLRPTEVLIVGNARGGTPLMQERQSVGIDLPLRFLAWEDAGGQVWVAYNDPPWIAQRHGLSAAAEPLAASLAHVLAELARAAAE